MDRTARLLFDYLKDILYHPDKAALDLNELPESFRKFGEGMQFLAECIREEREFAKALAKGDLSQKPPDGNNVIAAPIKALQGSLRHLAWQTSQVAKGDYNQSVDFMGEFSEAFNSMVRQLRERTSSLMSEKEMVEQKNRELRQTLELVLALTNYTHNIIFVFSASTNQLIFSNNMASWLKKTAPEVTEALELKLNEKHIGSGSELWETEADFGGNKGIRYYEVESFHIPWESEEATVHILIDDTDRKKHEDLMHSLAYVDPLTGLNNRRYALDIMDKHIKSGFGFLLSFIDVDYLKYCNDTFGHGHGDKYLTDVVALLKTLGGELCRVGGDEFLLIQLGQDPKTQDMRLNECRNQLMRQESPYPQSFSFATTAVPPDCKGSIEKYIKETDIKMYQYKRTHKKPLDVIGYVDNRT